MPLVVRRPGAGAFPLLAALAALALACGIAPITNNDIWLHLATGRWMAATWSVPGAEVFSYAAAGRPYVAHEWGSEMLFHLLHKLAGEGGLVAFKTAVGCVLGWATFRAGRARGATPAASAAAAGLALFVAAGHLWERPHLFTWMLAMAALALLRAARPRPRLLLLLPLLQIAWVNLHGGHVLGPLLVLGWTLGEAWRAWRGASGARPLHVAGSALGMGVASLVNPYGFDLLALPFELTGSEVFMQAVYEWRSPFVTDYAGTTMFAGAVCITGLLTYGIARRRAIDPADGIVLAGLLVLAGSMSRNVPLYALCAAGPLASALTPRAVGADPRRGSGGWVGTALVATALTAAALGIAAWGYPYGRGQIRPRGIGPGPEVPVEACDYLETIGARGKAFTTYGEGAYVIWRLWPDVRVGMDSRNSVYGEDIYLEYRAALRTPEGTAAYLDRWTPDLAVVRHSGPFRRGFDLVTDRDFDLPHTVFMASGRLRLVDFDDVTAVYLADTLGNAPRLEQDGYRVIHPVVRGAPYPPSDLSQAVLEGEKAVRRHPDSALARWILAGAYAQGGESEAALEQLAALDGLDFSRIRRWGVGKTFDAARLGLTGLLEHRRGRCPEARRALERALDIDPDYRPARDLLTQLGC